LAIGPVVPDVGLLPAFHWVVDDGVVVEAVRQAIEDGLTVELGLVGGTGHHDS